MSPDDAVAGSPTGTDADSDADVDADSDAGTAAGRDEGVESGGPDPATPGGDHEDEGEGDGAGVAAGLGPEADEADRRLADALQRVAHGAVVSVPSILAAQALSVAFTAVLTNGFTAGAYGLYVLARRLGQFLLRLSAGVGGGLSRFVPAADDQRERDIVATFAVVCLLGAAVTLGAALFVAAPSVAAAAGEGPRFVTYLRVFGAGLPATVWLFAAVGVLRAAEAVGAVNLLQRLAFPLAQLALGAVGVVLLGDLVAVAVGVVALQALFGLAAAGWAVRRLGFRPRLTGPGARAVRRRYLRYVAPLVPAAVATTVQRLGFYPLIAWFLSGTAGGIFAVGVLVGALVRLPLAGINQFVPPVAASLYADDQRAPLRRLYHVTSRLVLVATLAMAVPAVVFRRPLMGLFGPTFAANADLLPGFILAQVGACAAGSVGILLRMTDNQRALLVVNAAITAVLAVVAVPLTATHGVAGLVASYLLMLTLNNGVEVAVLYRLEGLQPFTRAHGKPVVAAVPLAVLALAARELVGGAPGAVAGTALGLAAYGLVLRRLGFAPVERRLVGTLAARYRAVLPGAG